MSKTPRKRRKSVTPKTPLSKSRGKPSYHTNQMISDVVSGTPALKPQNQLGASYLADTINDGVHSERKIATWPVDWLNAFKDRFAPAWLKRRYPVQYSSLVYHEMCWKTGDEKTTMNVVPTFGKRT